MIWDHDNDILQDALDFYNELNNRLQAEDWIELQSRCWSRRSAPDGYRQRSCGPSVRSRPPGLPGGLRTSSRYLPSIAEATGYFDLTVNA